MKVSLPWSLLCPVVHKTHPSVVNHTVFLLGSTQNYSSIVPKEEAGPRAGGGAESSSRYLDLSVGLSWGTRQQRFLFQGCTGVFNEVASFLFDLNNKIVTRLTFCRDWQTTKMEIVIEIT